MIEILHPILKSIVTVVLIPTLLRATTFSTFVYENSAQAVGLILLSRLQGATSTDRYVDG
jgi:hypothetical protein